MQPDAAGLIPVPVRFDWLRHLDAKGITAFFPALPEASHYRAVGDDLEVSGSRGMGEGRTTSLCLGRETAYLMLAPVLLARVREAKHTEPKENIPLEVAGAKLGI